MHRRLRLPRKATLPAAVAMMIVGCVAEGDDEPTAIVESTTTITTPAAEPTTTATTPTTTSTTVGPDEPPGLGLELITDRLAAPKSLIDLEDGRLLVSDQTGSVWVVDGGELADEPLLDLGERVLGPTSSSPELGLSGLAVAPDFDTTSRLYVFYTAPPLDPVDQRVDTLAEWRVSDASLSTVDADSERIIISQPMPSRDHVGDIIFDPTGMLLVGFGARTNDPEAQDPHTFAGSIIRIDPEGDPYSVPPDNPFADGGDGAPEVFSYGYRNPFRLSNDSEWGVLVALPMFSEKDQQVNVVGSGDNAGYPDTSLRIDSCFDGEVVPECLSTEEGDPISPPVFEYGVDVGRIVSGAVVYRGADMPWLDGLALVTDWQGNVVVATPGSEAPWPYDGVDLDLPPGDSSALLWALRTDSQGEVYVMTTSRSLTSGAVYRLIADGG